MQCLLLRGDFNHVDLKAVLPKFHQHVTCATRGANTLDKVYSRLLIGQTCVERVSNFCFLGVNIREDLTWGVHTTELVKKPQRRLYFLRVLRRHDTSLPKTAGVLLPLPAVCCFQAALWHRGKSSMGSQRQHRKSLAALSPN